MESFEESIEELRNQYYEAIKALQNENDILSALPKPDYKNFFPIMTGMIKILEQEEKEIKELLLKENPSDELYQYIKEDLEICTFKKNICKKLYEEAQEQEQIENAAEQKSHKHLFFATTDAGNIYFEKDLKDIPEEYYDVILTCLKRIEFGYKEENNEKAKPLNTVNSKLAGMHEIKEYQTRIIYKILAPDIAYVMLVRIKKDNNESLDRETIIERKKQTDKQFKKLKKDIKNEDSKKKLVEQQQKIKEKIISILINNRRGKRK